MAISWSQAWQGAIAAAEHSVQQSAPAARDYLRRVIRGSETAVKSLIAARVTGQIDQATFEWLLAIEKDTLAVELTALEVMSQAAAQHAINAFTGALTDAIVDGILW